MTQVEARADMTPTEMVVTVRWPLNGAGMSRQDRIWLDRIKAVIEEIKTVREVPL